MILVLGGTTEGKQVAELLEALQLPYLYTTKTNTETVVGTSGVQISGALDEAGMMALCREKGVHLMIDAAHPFATALHNTVFTVAHALYIPVIRFEREAPPRVVHPLVYYETSYDDTVTELKRLGSPLLLALSGVQSIPRLAAYWQHTTTYFRVLDRPESRELASRYAFPPEQLILAHPAEEVAAEVALCKRLNAGAMLTKESGHSGRQSIKVDAARQVGIPIFIMCKPALPDFDMVVSDVAALEQALTKTVVL